MKIVVINGSPKGQYSITLHTMLYIQAKNPKHEYEYINAGASIKLIEKDFTEYSGKLEAADLIVFAYPVYTFIAPSQLHRFIELMKENHTNLAGKYVTQITTSKHFYDVTAHRYVEENCADMGMKIIKGLSADMDDLTTAKGQKDAREFFRYVRYCMKNDITQNVAVDNSEPVHAKVTVPSDYGFAEEDAMKMAALACNSAPGEEESTTVAMGGADSCGEVSKTIALVCDLAPGDAQLSAMIDRFRAKSEAEVKVVNIHDFPFRGGCISCFNCAIDGTCIYQDGFSQMLRDEIQTCDAIVIAFTIKDHSMGVIFKTYDDRQFCNGHRAVTMGKPFGYLISGNYSKEENLKTIIRARADVGGNFLAGVASDESDPDGQIDRLALSLSFAMKRQYTQPQEFYGVGGMKIFRDLIWTMQGMMRADHKFYKEHGQYDFPQKKPARMLGMYLVGAMIGNKKIKSKMGNKMNEGMIAPYKKVVDKV